MAAIFIEVTILVLLAAICDIKTYRISNTITYPFMLIGLVTNICAAGLNGAASSLLGALLPTAILFIFFALRMLGAGDIKLFASIGAIAGTSFVLNTIVYSFIAGGIIALCVIISRKNVKQRLLHLLRYIKTSIITFSLQPYTDFQNKSDNAKFHFTYAIIIGSFAAIFIELS